MRSDPTGRVQAVDALLAAILACPDAEIVMESVLIARRGGSPRVAFCDLASNAALWAASCTPAELAIHARAAFDELGQRGFSKDIRRRLALELCAGLAPSDRRRVAQKIDAS